ncbi:MAG: hypothetical protein V1905_01050 [bacterium]
MFRPENISARLKEGVDEKISSIKENPLVARILDNLNIPSILDIAMAGPKRWAFVGKTILRGTRKGGEISILEKEAMECAEQSKEVAEKAGLEVCPVTRIESGPFNCHLAAMRLPDTSSCSLVRNFSFYAGSPEYFDISDSMEEIPEGNYLVAPMPTAFAGEFNNGVVIFPSGENSARVISEIQAHKGSLAIAYEPNKQRRCGKLTLLSPQETQQAVTNPDEVFPNGGVAIGTSFFLEADTNKPFSYDEIVKALEVSGYTECYNMQFGFLATEGDHAYYIKAILSPISKDATKGRFSESLARAVYGAVSKFQEIRPSLERGKIVLTEEEEISSIAMVNTKEMACRRKFIPQIRTDVPNLFVPLE